MLANLMRRKRRKKKKIKRLKDKISKEKKNLSPVDQLRAHKWINNLCRQVSKQLDRSNCQEIVRSSVSNQIPQLIILESEIFKNKKFPKAFLSFIPSHFAGLASTHSIDQAFLAISPTHESLPTCESPHPTRMLRRWSRE